MQNHLEIIMPPVPMEDIKARVRAIMRPYNLSQASNHYGSFWDFYSIGGRWSGHKLIQSLDQDKLKAFKALLNKRHFMISPVGSVKSSLISETHIEEVDRLWQEYFPDSVMTQCPFFRHSHIPYYVDVMTVKECLELSAHHVIFVDGAGEARFMVQKMIWNGLNYQETTWDSTIKSALVMCNLDAGEEVEMHDWLVVTVDYHC